MSTGRDGVRSLLRSVDSAWAAFEGSYTGLPESWLLEPGVMGEWSIKDILAHVTTWEAEALKHLPLIIARVAQDPLPRPLFPGTTFTCAIEELAAFLAQFLGGPPEAAQRRQWLSLRDSHRRFPIGPQVRDAWLHQMQEALAEVPLEERVRRASRGFFARSSAYLVSGA